MNWYRKLAQTQTQAEQTSIEEIVNLVDGIWRTLVQEKRKRTDQFVNHGVQQLFIQCENAARKIGELVKVKMIEQASQMCQTLQGLLGKVCMYINCEQIQESVRNVCILVNDLLSRKQEQPQRQQATPQPASQPAAPVAPAQPTSGLRPRPAA
jgi:hypothetical protein